MSPNVIILNGGSSSGKSKLVRELQLRLRDPWLAVGIDTFIGTLPPRMTGEQTGEETGEGTGGQGAQDGIVLGGDGSIGIGAEFTRLEICWMRGVAAMAAAGARIVVDDSFLSGPAAQQRWRRALEGLEVLWVGVHCSPEEAERREAARGDREHGMARGQALQVHQGIDYDLEVDTTDLDPAKAMLPILEAVRGANGRT
jgi:chloramphenicol 3-O phosphotransferase